jgi:hypothetical protein
VVFPYPSPNLAGPFDFVLIAGIYKDVAERSNAMAGEIFRMCMLPCHRSTCACGGDSDSDPCRRYCSLTVRRVSNGKTSLRADI